MADKIPSKEKPQICAIDLDREIVDALEDKGLHCFSGTLGAQVELPRAQGDQAPYQCHLSWDFPPNLHEYDLVIVDLQNPERIQYLEAERRNTFLKASKHEILVSRYTETIFNQRPLSSSILGEELEDFFAKETLTIVFCSPDEISTYYPMKWQNNKLVEDKPITKSLYGFMRGLGLHRNFTKNKTGKKVRVADIDKNLTTFLYNKNDVALNIHKNFNTFLHKYKENFTYNIIFKHPTEFLPYARGLDDVAEFEELENEDNYAPIKNFVPLLLNYSDEIVGFIDFSLETSVILAFPELHHNKKEFLLELIDELLPGLFPGIFPYCEQFPWLKSEKYFLPNQADIMDKKIKLKNEYEIALTKIEKEFQKNNAEYKFLHDLITETGELLVKSVENFFRGLGFESVVNMDETNPEIKEEDIQIILEEGLLVIEVKGIGGTSKDSECWQISKIKNRRAKERNSFDVFGLYIVNHQRYLPPIKRTNPPFTQNQIADAQSDERGLLTTYEIFKLYSYIENGFITKEDAKSSLLTYGLVKFKPSRSALLGSPLELYQNGQVVILNISNIPVNKSASIIVCHDEKWFRAEILEIRLDDETIESVSDGQIGIKLSRSVQKKSELWLEDTK